jgi:hypothetical protein
MIRIHQISFKILFRDKSIENANEKLTAFCQLDNLAKKFIQE